MRTAVDVWYIDLVADRPAMQSHLSSLSADEWARAERFHFPEHRDDFLTCRAALRLILADETSTNPEAICFRYGGYGKPEVPNSDLAFNVSHAGRRAVIAIARNCDVGVDIEPMRRIDDCLDLARIAFSERERTELEQSRDKSQAFLNGWTRKEAYIKALGTGLSERLQSFSVSLGEQATLLTTSERGGRVSDWTLNALPDRGYIVALAVRANTAAVRVRTL
jgi:4'-phosphopantetheinyl transferase